MPKQSNSLLGAGSNEGAANAFGNAPLRTSSRELVDTVRKNVSIDWTVKESVRAKLRVMVKRILRKYGYPPDVEQYGRRRDRRAPTR
jgi:type I restriction enzyme R subunit